MELLIALLIAFGVTTSKEEAMKIVEESSSIEKVLEENGINQDKIADYKDSIIGLEEADF